MSTNLVKLTLAVLIATVLSQQVGVCFMRGTSFNTATSGTITLTYDNTLLVTNITGTISGLAPKSVHGIHIHVYGDVSSPDGLAAGGHYNPNGKPHSTNLASSERHVGDLGNVVADANGVITVDIQSDLVNVTGTQSVIGRNLILHEKQDDGVTQPHGNAGNRFGQCVIGVQATTGNTASNHVASFASCEMRGYLSDVYGRILFSENADGTVTVNSTICGATSGSRGLHIHEFGDLSGSDITAKTGGHYNPFSQIHGYPMKMERHAGDLGNITILNGIGSSQQTLNLITLKGQNSIIGRSVVIHATFDDGVSQPSGNSGIKVGACVIGTVDTLPLGGYTCTIIPPRNYGISTSFSVLVLLTSLVVIML